MDETAGKTRILIVSANPETTKPLRLDDEKRGIEEGLRSANNREKYEIKILNSTRIAEFRREMLEYRPHILHFCGHGADAKGIIFENEGGSESFVEGEALADFLGNFKKHLRCVVLNACFSETQAEHIRKQIDYVIGMKEAIGDKAAIEFAISFYQAVFADCEYGTAFKIACDAVKMNGVLADDISPVILTRGEVEIALTPEQHRVRKELYLKKLKKGCEDKLKSIKSGIYNLSGNVFLSEQKQIYGADDFELHIPYQPIDESGEMKEKTNDICACENNGSKKVVLLGEPGSGKTVSLLKLTISFVDRALSDTEAPIPLLIPLGSYKETISPEQYAKKRMAIDSDYATELFNPSKCLFIFDGLNEVAIDKRGSVVKYIISTDHYIVSCRSLDYKQEFSKEKDIARIEILDLDLIQIKDAIAEGNARELWSAIGGNEYLVTFWTNLCNNGNESLFWKAPSAMKEANLMMLKEDSNTCDYEAWLKMHDKGLLPLCRNPMLLKMIYDLYLDSNSNLPQNRGKLFETFAERCIDSEIKKLDKKGEKSKSELEKLKSSTYDLLTCLAETIIVNQQGTGIEYNMGRKALSKNLSNQNLEEIEKFAHDAGILICDGIEYRFIHQLHQEYFASRSLQISFEERRKPTDFFCSANWWEPTGWEESAVILAGILPIDKLNCFLLWLSKVQPKLVIRCVENSGISGVSVDSIDSQTRSLLLNNWLDRLSHTDETAKSRIYIGQAMDKLGDPRDGVGIVKICGKDIPKIEWISFRDSGISMSKYPITVCQYATFLDDADGYRNDSWWKTSYESQEWHRQNYVIPLLPELGNAPITNISWYDATAFCRWLSSKSNEEIRLPSEQEWISCVSQDRPTICAITEHDLMELPDDKKWVSVGLTAEEGLSMMLSDLGLVWEWCSDQFGDRTDTLGFADPNSVPTRILKGGSWITSNKCKDSTYRLRTYATHMEFDIGFRIVKSLNNHMGGLEL